MHDGRVATAALGLDREVDRFVRVANADHRHDRHHLLGPHERMIDADIDHAEPQILGHVHADLLQDHAGVLADELAIDLGRFARAADFVEDQVFELLGLRLR